MKWKNKGRFSEKLAWPDKLDGSYVTYGWVLIFSALEKTTTQGANLGNVRSVYPSQFQQCMSQALQVLSV